MKKHGLAAGAFFSTLLFGLGLGISGMTRPEKIIGFLTVGRDWDPTLAIVMATALAVHMVAYRFILRRRSPLVAPRFEIPSRRDLDWRLAAGAALFGAGWGLGGYCPGPALVSSVAGGGDVWVFLAAMTAGIAAFQGVKRFGSLRVKSKEVSIGNQSVL